MSRRAFLGSTAGGTALALLRPDLALSSGRPRSSILTDYVGRLCYNENPLGPSPEAITAITDSASMAHRYPDWYAESLKSSLASHHSVSTGQIIVGCGATEVLRLAALAFANTGGNVVCPYPSYSQFPSDSEFLGASVRYSSLDENHRVDPADLAALVDTGTSAICITNPNNPTGTVMSAASISDLVDSMPSQVAVIIDEAYNDYVHDTSYTSALDLIRQGKNVLVVRTFSKAHGLAGARIGYAIGRQDWISSMSAWHLFGTVSRMSQAAARSALDDTQHISNTVSLNDQAKQYCFDNFATLGLDYIPSETNFFMVDVARPAYQVSNLLAQQGIQVRTGWGMPNHLRVSTGTMEEMEKFIAVLQEFQVGGEPGSPPSPVLYANYPNPVSDATCLSYYVPDGGHVLLQIYNIRGQLVRTLYNDTAKPGYNSIDWNCCGQRGNRAVSGSYFYRLTNGSFTETRRMILLH